MYILMENIILLYYNKVHIICAIKIVIKYFTTTEIQLNMYNTDLTVRALYGHYYNMWFKIYNIVIEK